MSLSTLLPILPLLIEGSKNGSDIASVGINDSPKAAKRAVFLSSVVTLLTDDELDKETVFELKELSTAGSDCKDTVPLSTSAKADDFDNITEFC